MKVLVVLALAALASARNFNDDSRRITAYGYIQDVAIPLAKAIRKAEASAPQSTRIIGGSTAQLGQFPFQAGLILSYQGVSDTGVCGGSLVASNRVLTAAHCYYDGITQANSTTVVLGSVTLMSGGTRIETTDVVVHSNWSPILDRNDIAVLKLPSAVTYTSGSLALSFVESDVITNIECFLYYPLKIRSSNICTSGASGYGISQGDSGSPLALNTNNRTILIGIVSFGPNQGTVGFPIVFTRVTFYTDFLDQNL